MESKYHGITHILSNQIKSGDDLSAYKETFCKKGMHLLGEVRSLNAHYLVCDACGLIVHIEKIEYENNKEGFCNCKEKSEEKIPSEWPGTFYYNESWVCPVHGYIKR